MKKPCLTRRERVFLEWHRTNVIKTSEGALIEHKLCWLRLFREIRKLLER